MACQVKRDNKGAIRKVEDSNGNESQLFNYINTLPHIQSKEQALEIYNESLKNQKDNSTLTKQEEDTDPSFQTIYQALKKGDTLEQAAKQNDLYLEEIEVGKDLLGKGDENTVYGEGNGYVTKVNNLSMHESPMEFMHR